MSKSKRKPRIMIESHKDTDGQAPIVLASTVKSIKCDWDTHSYETIDDAVINFIESGEIDNYDFLFITDISVKDEKAIELLEKYSHKVKLLDHHKTALELNKYEWATVITEIDGVKTCGASLFYEYFKEFCEERGYENNLSSQIVKDYVESVRLYDTWDWTTTDEETLKKYQPEEHNLLYFWLGMFKYTSFMKDKLLNQNQWNWNQTEDLIIKTVQKAKELYCNKKLKEMKVREMYIKHADNTSKLYKFGLVIAGEHTSDLGKFIMENNEDDIEFIMIVAGTNKVSLRTNKDVDLTPIVLRYNGGGHPQSCGMDFDDKFMARIFRGY